MSHISAQRPRSGGELDDGRELLVVAPVVLLAWIPAALADPAGAVIAWGLTGAAAVLAGLLAWRRPQILLLALLPASLLAATGLVPDAGRYQPTAVVAAPLALMWAMRVARGRVSVTWPHPAVAISLIAYVAWCAVTTLTSSARLGSLVYLGGIVATLALLYEVVPGLCAGVRERKAVLMVVAALGIVCAGIGIALVAGPVVLFGRSVGQYEIYELTVVRNPTGIILPRIIGPFFASNGQGINCALGLIAVVALRVGLRGRARTVMTVAAVLVLAALLDSFSRNGWLLAIIGLGVVAGPEVARRRPGLAAISSGIMVAAFMLLLVNVVGADRRQDLMAARYGAAGSSVSGDLSAPPPASPAGPSSPIPTAEAPSLAPTDDGSAGGSSAPGAPTPESSSAPSGTVEPTPSEVPSNSPSRLALRGGSGLTGRIELWKASIKATEQRPVFGWGLGQVIEAIAPYVPDGLGLNGLTSHSTWFRTAVETGIPGLLALVAWVLASGALILRRLITDRAARTDPIRLAFVGSFLGLTAAATFDTFLLGGLTFMNIYWALSAVLAAAAVAPGLPARDLNEETVSRSQGPLG